MWPFCSWNQEAWFMPARSACVMIVSSVFYLVYRKCFLLAPSSSELPAGWCQFRCLSHVERQMAFVGRLSLSLFLLSYYWWPPCLNSVLATFPLMNFPNPVSGQQLNVLPPANRKCSVDCLSPTPPNLRVYPSSSWFLEESDIWHSGQAWRKWLPQLKVGSISICF